MRIATLSGRAVVVAGDVAIDIEKLSEGRFGPDTSSLFEDWVGFAEWAAGASFTSDLGVPYADSNLDAPVPDPKQVFAIGLNYRAHVVEAGVAPPANADTPPTFTKFKASLTGPYTELTLPSGSVDWEVELVAVMGKRAENVKAHDAWGHVAGLTVGQDFSERDVQRSGPVPQFSMGKSFPGFGPTGPWLVTVDEFADPDDLALECIINGEIVQSSRTSAMILPVGVLIERLSAICPLLPGDLIFTGTPAGVGMGRNPEKYLKAGDEVVSRIEGIGEIRQRCVV
jgi:2-keto-4-pentenoate hydratase/2-oxohepta-3-ene-1,7-dioic acid hydratase in catechol pathway